MWQLICDHLSATFYLRAYYRLTSEILAEHRSARRRRALYAIDCALFAYVHRTLWIAYVVYADFAPIRNDADDKINIDMLRNDLALEYIYRNRHRYDSFVFVAIYMLFAFYWYCETTFYRLDSSRITWRSWYAMVVVSQDAYRAAVRASVEETSQTSLRYSGPSGPSILVTSAAMRVYRSIVARVRRWWTLASVDQRRLSAVLPGLPPRLRRSAILFLVFADHVAFIIQALIVYVFLAMTFMLAQNKQFCTNFGLVRILAKLYLTHYMVQRLLRSAIFCTYCSLFTIIVFGRRLNAIYDRVRTRISRHRCSVKYRKNRSLSDIGVRNASLRIDGKKRFLRKFAAEEQKPLLLSRKRCGSTIDMLLATHNKVCYLVLRGSEDMFGRVLFAFLLTHLPINVYIVQRITFETMTHIDFMLMSITFCFQAIATLAVIFPLAWCCAIYHSPKRFVPALQAIIGTPRWLPCKLKLDDLYGRLVSGPKIGVSIGPMEAVTYKTALEFILIYVAYIMMAFNRKISIDLQRARISKSNE